MGITILTLGSTETGRSVHELAQELAYALGRSFDLERAASLRAETIVLAIRAVPSARGTFPNRTSLSRAHAESRSSFSMDVERYAAGDARTKLESFGAALIGAINQVPEKRI